MIIERDYMKDRYRSRFQRPKRTARQWSNVAILILCFTLLAFIVFHLL